MKKDRNLHYFDKRVAKKFTVNAAIVLNNIDFWIKANKEQNKREVFKNNRWWTYSTISDYSKVMSYFTVKQIRKGLDDLREAGILIKDCFNENSYDRTSWYTIDYDKFDKIFNPKSQVDSPSKADETDLEGESSYKENIKENVKELQTPQFSKNEISEKNEILKEEPKTISLNDNHSILKTTTGGALKNKVTDIKEIENETNQNNNLKSTETTLESTNANKPICLYSEVAKMALNSYNEIAKRKYSFKTWGDTIIKRLKAEFSKEQIQDPQTFELIKTMLEVKWNDTTPDQKGFAQLPIKNYEISTLFSPSKFKTYIQAAENTLLQNQNRKQKAAENKKSNIFDSII